MHFLFFSLSLQMLLDGDDEDDDGKVPEKIPRDQRAPRAAGIGVHREGGKRSRIGQREKWSRAGSPTKASINPMESSRTCVTFQGCPELRQGGQAFIATCTSVVGCRPLPERGPGLGATCSSSAGAMLIKDSQWLGTEVLRSPSADRVAPPSSHNKRSCHAQSRPTPATFSHLILTAIL